MVQCKSAAKEVSFEWSHHRISATDSKVRTTLHVSINRRPVSSIGKAPDHRAGGRGFEPRPDHKPGSLNNW